MNCDTYLSMLETLPVDELAYGDAADHAATCRDCDRVTRVVAERERNMLLAYGSITPPVTTGPLTAHAIELSRRRRVAFFYRAGLVVAAVVAVLGFIMTRRVRPTMARTSEAFQLRCLAPEQAVEVLRNGLSPDVEIVSRSGWNGVIRVVARPAEMQVIRSRLDAVDNAARYQCATVPRAARAVRVEGP